MKKPDNLRVTETLVTVKEMLGAPGIPTSRKGLSAWIKREGIASSVCNARSGERKFLLAAFPGETQAWYLRRHAAPSAEAATLTGAERETIWLAYEAKSDKHKQTAETYLAAVKAFLALVAHGIPKGEAAQAVSKSHGIKPRTLHNCRKAVDGKPRDIWLPILAPDYVGAGRAADCDPSAWEFIKSDYLRLEKPSFASCYRRLQRTAAEKGWNIPIEKTLQRRIEQQTPREVRILQREGEAVFERTYPALIRDRSSLRALKAVNADGHKFDVFAQWPDGEIGRPVLLAWQDIYSGKFLSWRVGKTENTDAVRLSFGDLIEDHGIPDDAVLDNGRGFAAKWMTGGIPNRYRFKVKEEEPEGILTNLGVSVHWTIPYHGQSKPIERAFRDMCDCVAKHPEFAGAYTGNNPNNKPENYRSRAVPIKRFLEIVDSEINEINARTGRRGGLCDGRSFNEVFAESYEQGPVRKATAAQRRMCLLTAEQVRADRETGAVHLNVDKRNRYWTEELPDHAGELLTVRFDPDELHSSVHVYTRDNRYLCEAPCTHAAGFLDSQAASEHQRARNKYKKAVKEQAAAEASMTARQVAALIPIFDDSVPPETNVVRPLFPNASNPTAARRHNGAADDGPDNVANIGTRRRAEQEEQDDLIAYLVSPSK